eukprot:scaffold49132_cov32-Attheya_sp.AAC.2
MSSTHITALIQSTINNHQGGGRAMATPDGVFFTEPHLTTNVVNGARHIIASLLPVATASRVSYNT